MRCSSGMFIAAVLPHLVTTGRRPQRWFYNMYFSTTFPPNFIILFFGNRPIEFVCISCFHDAQPSVLDTYTSIFPRETNDRYHNRPEQKSSESTWPIDNLIPHRTLGVRLVLMSAAIFCVIFFNDNVTCSNVHVYNTVQTDYTLEPLQ